MRAEGRVIVAAFILVVCCAGPVIAGGALLAAITGFVSGAWAWFGLGAVLCGLALLVAHHRSRPTGE